MIKRLAFIAALGVVAALFHTQLFYSNWGERIEMYVLDFWFNFRGAEQAPSDIMIVAMDEDSYQELSLPMDKAWPRSTHAKLLERLAKAKAKRVVFDIAFLEKSSSEKADAELAKALGELPTVIGADSGTSVGAFKIEQLLLPYTPFRKAAEAVALVGFPEDAGVVRRFKTERTGRTKDYPTLAEAAVELNGDSTELPGERDFIRYFGPPGTIETFSYYEVIDPEIIADEELEGKTLFVGLMLRTELGPAQKDSFVVPFWSRGRMFGVEIHATSAANLRDGNWIRRSSPWVEGILLALVALVVSGLLFFLRPVLAGLVLIGAGLAWLCLAYLSFRTGHFMPGAVLCGIVLPICYMGSTLYYYFVSSKAQRQTQRAFEHYLSPAAAREMAKNPEALKAGGENVYATAMFTDIVGFTPITEKMIAEDVARMLNSYFTEVMEVVFDEEGTLIKFIGDAAFAIWGAPIKAGDHADRAARTALVIQEKVREFNASGRFPELKTRVGVHTGPMVVGNLGSQKRFDYTAIGDAVNLSSRLEGLNSYFGTEILISDATEKELKSPFHKVKLGNVSVKGKSQAVGIYTLLHEALSDDVEDRWRAALLEFSSRRWDRAMELFSEVKKREPRLVGAADLYLTKTVELSQDEVFASTTADWHGELTFDTK